MTWDEYIAGKELHELPPDLRRHNVFEHFGISQSQEVPFLRVHHVTLDKCWRDTQRTIYWTGEFQGVVYRSLDTCRTREWAEVEDWMKNLQAQPPE